MFGACSYYGKYEEFFYTSVMFSSIAQRSNESVARSDHEGRIIAFQNMAAFWKKTRAIIVSLSYNSRIQMRTRFFNLKIIY